MLPSPGPTVTRLISLRTSCTGATMSTRGAWTPATPPGAPRGGASPARWTTPCAGPTGPPTSSAAGSTGRCWTASRRWRPGSHGPRPRTGSSAGTHSPAPRAQTEWRGPTPGRGSAAAAVPRTATRDGR
uniref:Matrix metallopeptidase 17 n=1 Tax=Rousettus aegyptiacus TaxID=9407 RepID=A0A7J8H288_ROUAE|nr:matrix metallopeptidase 17 [Rousettus aegyptiacus]